MREAQTFLDSEHRVRKRTGAGRCIRGESDARQGRLSRVGRKVCGSNVKVPLCESGRIHHKRITFTVTRRHSGAGGAT